MWKKLRSNRDPRDTLLSELKKEFAPYISAAGGRFTLFFAKYPRFTYGLMITMMLVSLVLSFTLFSDKQPVKVVIADSPSATVDDGFAKIAGLTDRISESIELKKTADSLNRKQHLDHADSLKLLRTLERLQQLITH